MKLWIFDEHSRYWYTLPDIYLVVFVYVGKNLNILHATCSFVFKKWVPSSLSHQSLTGVCFLKLDRIFYVSEDTVRHLPHSSDSDLYIIFANAINMVGIFYLSAVSSSEHTSSDFVLKIYFITEPILELNFRNKIWR